MHIQVQFLHSKKDYKQLKYYETDESVLEFLHSTIKKELIWSSWRKNCSKRKLNQAHTTCFKLAWKLQRRTHEIHLIASPTTPNYKTDKLKTKLNSLKYKLVCAEILRILAFRPLLESFYHSCRTEESWMTSSRKCSSIQTIKKNHSYTIPSLISFMDSFSFLWCKISPNHPESNPNNAMTKCSSNRKLYLLGSRTVCWECSGECQLKNWI